MTESLANNEEVSISEFIERISTQTKLDRVNERVNQSKDREHWFVYRSLII